MAKKRRPVEVEFILKKLDSKTLASFSSLKNTEHFDRLEEFSKRYAQTKRNEIIDLDTENERKFANEAAIRKGAILGVGTMIEVIRGATKEVKRRSEE